MTPSVVLRPEDKPLWDDTKRRFIVEESPGAFRILSPCLGAQLSGHWWRVELDGDTVGYAWLSIEEEGVAELSVAIGKHFRSQRVGRTVLGELEREAAQLGFKRVIGVVQSENPQQEKILSWLFDEGYSACALPDLDAAKRVVKRQDVTMKKEL